LIKPISNIVIRDEHDIYTILTNREKLECLLQEYENNYQLDKEVICYDENTPCVPIENKKMMIIDAINCNNANVLHKGKNRHSKNTEENDGLDIEHLKPDLNSKIKEELEKSDREQLIMLKEYKQNIIDFILDNKESIKVEDLKIYEPIYKCYRDKGNCHVCNTLTNIICFNCNCTNKEFWLCTNHWKQHSIDNHE
jgi:hypothetical protein